MIMAQIFKITTLVRHYILWYFIEHLAICSTNYKHFNNCITFFLKYGINLLMLLDTKM